MAIKTDTFTGAGGGGAVDSVNGQTGVVVVSGDDIAADHSASNYTAANANIDGHLSGIDTKLGTLATGLTYQGAFNATTGAPSIANASQGDLYVISVAGTIYGQTWAVGDHLLINADMGGSVDNAKIDKIDNTDQVTSVNTQTGAVVLSGNDLAADHTASNYTAANANIDGHLSGIDTKFGTLGTASTAASTDFLQVSNNLSDLNNAGTARTNLGLGTSATLNTGTANGDVVALDATGLPAVDGSQLTGITATDSTKLAIANNLSDLNNATTARTNLGLGTAATSASADFLAVSNNLSDLNNVGTARTNLGLGTSATLNTGTANGDVVVLDATGLPAVDGSQLTGVVSTDSSKLAIANNLSDLNNVGTARTNLGLGTAATSASADFLAVSNNLSDLNNATTARTNLGLGTSATLNTGTANGDVVVLDATGLPAVDGSQLTGITATDSTKLAITNNLSDLNNAGTARTNLGLGTAATSASTAFLSAIGPDSLGGNIDVNGHDIISSSNGDIEVDPNGTGSFKIKGNATSGSGRLILNCEQNTHGITLKGPPHSAAASYTLTFPNTDGTADQVLKTDGSGALDWVDQAGGGSAPSVTTDSSGTDTTISTSTGIEEIHLINNSTNNVVITIPTGATAGAGYKYNIKRLGTGTVSVTPSSGTIDTAASFSLASQYDSVTVVSDGTNYHIV